MSYKLKNIKVTPIKGAKELTISSKYGKRTFYNKVTKETKTSFHKALDIINGTYVVAVADGVVIASKNNVKGYTEKQSSGNYVTIKHDSGIITTYCHMKYDSVHLKAGDKVKKGDVLGIKGATGYATGPHLHFDVKVGNDYVDPTEYLLGIKSFEVKLKEEKSNSSTYLLYTIKKGDTLSAIALNYGCTINELVKINDIKNPNLIYIGNELKIPLTSINVKKNESSSSKTKNDNKIIYTVKKGDNLSKIAKKYNTTWKKIYEKNKSIIGKNPNIIYPGQVLVI